MERPLDTKSLSHQFIFSTGIFIIQEIHEMRTPFIKSLLINGNISFDISINQFTLILASSFPQILKTVIKAFDKKGNVASIGITHACCRPAVHNVFVTTVEKVLAFNPRFRKQNLCPILYRKLLCIVT